MRSPKNSFYRASAGRGWYTDAMRKKNPVKAFIVRLAALGALAVVAAAGALAFTNALVVGESAPHISSALSEQQPAQVAIVLGAKVMGNGTPSSTLADRVAAGVALYRAGKVKKLLLSGDHGQTSYDEVDCMRAYAEKVGVPAEDIFMDHAGFNTYDTMYRARDIFKVKSAIVVTQKYHLWRSVYLAKSLGLEVSGFPADKSPMHTRDFIREVLARANAVLEVSLTHPKPRILGSAIPITGDGRATENGKS